MMATKKPIIPRWRSKQRRVTIQVVEVTGNLERHVKKVTIYANPTEVMKELRIWIDSQGWPTNHNDAEGNDDEPRPAA